MTDAMRQEAEADIKSNVKKKTLTELNLSARVLAFTGKRVQEHCTSTHGLTHRASARPLHESSSLSLGLGEHVQTAEAEDTTRLLLGFSSCASRGTHTNRGGANGGLNESGFDRTWGGRIRFLQPLSAAFIR
jgi:hypothetical protein